MFFPKMKRKAVLGAMLGVSCLAGLVAGPAVAGEGSVWCADLKGAAYGLCTAYYDGMECNSGVPQATSNACSRVAANFTRITGQPLPHEDGVCAEITQDNPEYDRYEGPRVDNACVTDADCFENFQGIGLGGGGFFGEVCAAVNAFSFVVDESELLSPLPTGTCGCYQGQCQWLTTECSAN